MPSAAIRVLFYLLDTAVWLVCGVHYSDTQWSVDVCHRLMCTPLTSRINIAEAAEPRNTTGTAVSSACVCLSRRQPDQRSRRHVRSITANNLEKTVDT